MADIVREKINSIMIFFLAFGKNSSVKRKKWACALQRQSDSSYSSKVRRPTLFHHFRLAVIWGFKMKCDCSKVKTKHTTVKSHNIQIFHFSVLHFPALPAYISFYLARIRLKKKIILSIQMWNCLPQFHCIWKKSSKKSLKYSFDLPNISGSWLISLGKVRD